MQKLGLKKDIEVLEQKVLLNQTLFLNFSKG